MPTDYHPLLLVPRGRRMWRDIIEMGRKKREERRIQVEY
jgi:hypothetical protein